MSSKPRQRKRSGTPSDAGADRPTTIPNLLIGVFLLVQLLLPIRGLFLDDYDSRSNFSWNMYSIEYACDVSYLYRSPDNRVRVVDFERYFRQPERAPMVFHRDVLPRFHAWLCEAIPEDTRRGSIRALVQCSVNRGAPRQLVPPDTAICDPPAYGVAPR